MLSVLRQHLRPGGILLADNVFFDGDILESRFAIRRRDRTIHGRMREFLFTITHDNDFITDILPVADGMSVSVFRPCGKEDETS